MAKIDTEMLLVAPDSNRCLNTNIGMFRMFVMQVNVPVRVADDGEILEGSTLF